MRLRMTYLELQKHVQQQIRNILCFDIDISKYMLNAIHRTEQCLVKTTNRFLNTEKEQCSFSVFNSVHYCIFLYHLGRMAFEMDKDCINAEKIYYLNKILNSIDIFYEVKLPQIWSVEHPLGAIMGKAKYSDYFFFYQGCTVGGNRGFYPTIGNHVTMYSNSKILGNSKIGNNVIISANTYIKDEDIPNNCIVFGQSPNLIVKKMSPSQITEITSHIWSFGNEK